MNKLLSVIVAAMFAASTAFVASPVGAQTKDDKKKTEMKEKKKSAKGEKKAAPKKEGKATKKKDEMKK